MKITSVWPLIRKQQWPSCGFKFQISCLTCVPALWQSVHRRVASHQRWCFSSRACLARRRSNSNYLDVIPVGKWLIIGITPKWQFHGQKMNNHQIQAYPVFRQIQLVGPLTKSYPQFTYQLVTGIILQLPMTFLCYDMLWTPRGPRHIRCAPFDCNICGSNCQTQSLQFPSQSDKTFFGPLNTLDLPKIVWILSIKTALNWYKPGKPGQVPPGQTRLTLLTCFKGGTLHPRRDVIDTAQGKSSLGSCHVNSMVSPTKIAV